MASILDRQANDLAVGAEALERSRQVGLERTPIARHVAAIPSKVKTRRAPSLLPAKSVFSRSLKLGDVLELSLRRRVVDRELIGLRSEAAAY